jgi:DNA-binding NarL/FixJ family response regulator
VAVALQPIRNEPVAAPTIHIAIVDGARLVGDALAALLNGQADMEVVANVDFAGVSGLPAVAPCPDVAIVDFGGDAESAARAVERLHRADFGTRVIILADRIVSFRAVFAAIHDEAAAIVSGDEPAERLLRVIRLVFSGHTLIQPSLVVAVMRDKRAREASLRRITRREMEVLRLLSTGVGSRQIATSLGMGYATVRTHMRNLGGKLSAHSKLEIVVRAYELDLIREPDRMRVAIGS